MPWSTAPRFTLWASSSRRPVAYFGGNLTVVDLPEHRFCLQPDLHQRRNARGRSRMIDGRRQYALDRHDQMHQRRARRRPPAGYGCLTMSTPPPTRLPCGALPGRRHRHCGGHRLAQDLHGEGGQVYIYSTVDGSSIDNQYVTVTGTAYDVAYMDGLRQQQYRLLNSVAVNRGQ